MLSQLNGSSFVQFGSGDAAARERRDHARRAAARRRHRRPDEREGCEAPHSEAAEELMLDATPADAATAAAVPRRHAAAVEPAADLDGGGRSPGMFALSVLLTADGSPPAPTTANSS